MRVARRSTVRRESMTSFRAGVTLIEASIWKPQFDYKSVNSVARGCSEGGGARNSEKLRNYVIVNSM